MVTAIRFFALKSREEEELHRSEFRDDSCFKDYSCNTQQHARKRNRETHNEKRTMATYGGGGVFPSHVSQAPVTLIGMRSNHQSGPHRRKAIPAGVCRFPHQALQSGSTR